MARAIAALAEEMRRAEESGVGFKVGVVVILPAEHYGIAHEDGVFKPGFGFGFGNSVKIQGHRVEPQELTFGELGKRSGARGDRLGRSGLRGSGFGGRDLGRRGFGHCGLSRGGIGGNVYYHDAAVIVLFAARGGKRSQYRKQ